MSATQQQPETFNFTTTLIGDTVQLSGDEFVVLQKYWTERKLLLRASGSPSAYPRFVSEFDFDRGQPALVRAKGKA